MQEILFRGKRKDTKEWVYWDVFGQIVCDDGKTFNFVTYFGINYWNIVDLIPLLIHETIGQWTGLTDKNGVNIFEGDIVDCTSELFTNWGKTPTGRFVTVKYEIVWNEDGWATREIHNDRWDSMWNNFGRISQGIYGSAKKFYVVIGSIHDNPEFLKEEGAE